MSTLSASLEHRGYAAGGPARVRYAPSPTGEPHIGNIRTAIWSWLYARHTGGQFLVRIEDTDQSREIEGSVGRILESLRWLGLTWDEGPDIGGPYAPYVQSQRLDDYRAAARRLLDSDHAYPCFCSPERLDALRKEQQAQRRSPGYDGRCRTIPRAEAAARAASEPHVVRFKVPHEGSTTVEDLLRGPITVENRTLDDFVILKSDGFPTYHLAHPVDDTAMRITHVTRGDEWLPSAPRHALIFDALGYPRPIYVHNAIILAPGGGKLSKRHGAKSVLEFAEDGYLPDAVVNFLCITGWGHGDDTVMSREELIRVFDMADLSLAPATFDIEKLNWMNGVYLRNMPIDQLVEHIASRLERDLPIEVPRPLNRTMVAAFTPLIRERIQLLSEVLPLVDFLYATDIPTPPVDQFLVKRWRGEAAKAADALGVAIAAVDGSEWTAEALEAALRGAAETASVSVGDLFSLIRLAVTGKSVTPPLFESMAIAGARPCLTRLQAAEAALREAV